MVPGSTVFFIVAGTPPPSQGEAPRVSPLVQDAPYPSKIAGLRNVDAVLATRCAAPWVGHEDYNEYVNLIILLARRLPKLRAVPQLKCERVESAGIFRPKNTIPVYCCMAQGTKYS